MTKPRLVVYLCSDLFVRNYVQTGVLSRLQEHYEVKVLLSADVTMGSLCQRAGLDTRVWITDPERLQAYGQLYDVMTWRFRDRSKTFLYRFLRTKGLSHLLRKVRASDLIAHPLFHIAPYLHRRNIWETVCRGSRIYFPHYWSRIMNRVAPEARLPSLPDADLAIMPSSAFDPQGVDFIRSARRHGTRSLLLIDNWDNLSSKSVFPVQPDFMAVWGEQSLRHAVEIHGFDRSKVFKIGTPRFEAYEPASLANMPSPFPFRYLLFVGCAIPFDETAVLAALDRTISESKGALEGVKIVYRPHPWRQSRDREERFVDANFRCTVLDPQVADSYNGHVINDGTGKGLQPDLDYYPALLKGAEMVVGPLTTMLIEALLVGKRVVGLTTDDGVHTTSPSFAIEWYRHFEGLENLPDLKLVDSLERLMSEVREIATHNEVLGSRDALGDFVESGSEGYEQRLDQAIRDSLGWKS